MIQPVEVVADDLALAVLAAQVLIATLSGAFSVSFTVEGVEVTVTENGVTADQ